MTQKRTMKMVGHATYDWVRGRRTGRGGVWSLGSGQTGTLPSDQGTISHESEVLAERDDRLGRPSGPL